MLIRVHSTRMSLRDNNTDPADSGMLLRDLIWAQMCLYLRLNNVHLRNRYSVQMQLRIIREGRTDHHDMLATCTQTWHRGVKKKNKTKKPHRSVQKSHVTITHDDVIIV